MWQEFFPGAKWSLGRAAAPLTRVLLGSQAWGRAAGRMGDIVEMKHVFGCKLHFRAQLALPTGPSENGGAGPLLPLSSVLPEKPQRRGRPQPEATPTPTTTSSHTKGEPAKEERIFSSKQGTGPVSRTVTEGPSPSSRLSATGGTQPPARESQISGTESLAEVATQTSSCCHLPPLREGSVIIPWGFLAALGPLVAILSVGKEEPKPEGRLPTAGGPGVLVSAGPGGWGLMPVISSSNHRTPDIHQNLLPPFQLASMSRVLKNTHLWRPCRHQYTEYFHTRKFPLLMLGSPTQQATRSWFPL